MGFCLRVEGGIRELVRWRGLGDVYKREGVGRESEVGGRKSEVGGGRLEIGGWRLEVRGNR